DHPYDVVIRGNPAGDEGVDTHPCQTDLASRTRRMLKSQSRELALMSAPPHFCGRRALFPKTLDAPRSGKLVDLFGLVCNLSVGVAAVDDFDAKLVRQVIELPGGRMMGNLFQLSRRQALLSDGTVCDVQERLLREVADETWIGAMLENRSDARLF